MEELIKVDILTRKDLSAFKDGVADAILNGTKDDNNRNHYYKQGYEFGVTLYADFIVQNDFLKERKEKI